MYGDGGNNTINFYCAVLFCILNVLRKPISFYMGGFMKLFVCSVFIFLVVSFVYASSQEVEFDQAALTNQLFDAVDEGAIAKVQDLFARGASLRDADGCTVLHHAAHHGNLEMSAFLLTHYFNTDGSDCGFDDADSYGRTPALIAADNGHAHVLNLLLNHRASPMVTDDHGRSILHYLAHKGSGENVTFFVETYNADVNQLTRSDDEFDDTSLGESPLYIAAQYKNVGAVEALLWCKADPNKRSYDLNSGLTPLYIAVENGYFDIVNLLIKGGANLYLRCFKESLLDVVVEECVPTGGFLEMNERMKEPADHRGVLCLLVAGYNSTPINYGIIINYLESKDKADLFDLLRSSFGNFCKNPSVFLESLVGSDRQEKLDELLLYSYWMHSQPLIDQLLVAGASQKGAYVRQLKYRQLKAMALEKMRQFVRLV
jgi:ankyrin repeat protein